MSEVVETPKKELPEAVLRRDNLSNKLWLEFPSKPTEDERAALKTAGWRWGSYRKQWYHPSKFGRVPALVSERYQIEDGGEAYYSEERSDRLAHNAERQDEKSQEYRERVEQAVGGIPFGQPILVGHHSERHHRKAIEKADAAMNKSVEAAKYADHLEYKSKSSLRHQAHLQQPGTISRRLVRLRAEAAKIERNLAKTRTTFVSSMDSAENVQMRLAAWREEVTHRLEIIKQEIAENEQALTDAGGLLADRLEVGDIIIASDRYLEGEVSVVKVNTKTIKITAVGGVYANHTRLMDKSEVKQIVRKANGSNVQLDGEVNEPVQAQPVQPYITTSTSDQPEPEPDPLAEKIKSLKNAPALHVKTVAFFPTPPDLVRNVMLLALDIYSGADLVGKRILEPSAGLGAITNVLDEMLRDHLAQNPQGHAQAGQTEQSQSQNLTRVDMVEITFVNANFLHGKVVQEYTEQVEWHTYNLDFLEYTPEPDLQDRENGRGIGGYNLIVMNPPFSLASDKKAYITHTLRAWAMLKPGGKMVVIAPAGLFFASDNRTRDLVWLIESNNGGWQRNPENSFSEAGTNVSTVTFWLTKPKPSK